MKTKTFYIILIILGLVFFSCKQEKSIKDYIDGGDYKYWSFTHYSVNKSSYMVYYFGEDGVYLKFQKRVDKSNREILEEYNGGDDLYEKQWRMLSDSLLLEGDYYVLKVIKMNRDTMIYRFIGLYYDYGIAYKDTFRVDTLYAVPKHLIPWKNRKRYKKWVDFV